MARIPKNIRDEFVIPSLRPHLISRGKVRDMYNSPLHPNHLVSVTTDRISIFDFVLNAQVSQKGEVLTALTHFWFTHLLNGVTNHLVQSGGLEELRHSHPDVPTERTLLIHRLKILPFELIFRAHLGGSVWKQYEQGGTVAGVRLAPGLTKWQQLSEPLFTPSTKSEDGHDVNISQDEYFAKSGDIGRQAEALARAAYVRAYQYALSHGIAILDTKFEVGVDEAGQVVLADEVLTPDSSRFTLVDNLVEALQGRTDPPFFDKEPVRAWGRTIHTPFPSGTGINGLNPKSEDQVAFVHELAVPESVTRECTTRYLDIFRRLTGITLDEYRTKNKF